MQARDRLLFIAIFLTSFASMGFEIIVARLLSQFTYNFVLAQALTISFFILGMGVGSYLFKYIQDKTAATLVKIEITLFLVALMSLFVIYALQVSVERSGLSHAQKIGLLLSVPQVLVFIVGALAGTEIPFFEQLLKINSKKNTQPNPFGLILALSYVGSFAASFLIVAALLPVAGLFNTFNCLLLVIVIATYLLCLQVKKNSLLAIVASLSLFTGLNFYLAPDLQQIYLKNFYYGQPSTKKFWQVAEFPQIEHFSTTYQEIDVVPDLFSFYRLNEYYLFMDQKLQYASRNETVYHESMVHGAINLNKSEPQNVLVLGGGEGLVVRELLKYTSIKKIDLVELDEKILEIASTHPLFLKQNQNSPKNPKVHVTIDDAYTWVKKTNEKYDAIFIDLPHPFSVELSRLYSYEFYSFVKRTLQPNGFIVFDFPLNHLQSGELKVYPANPAAFIFDTLTKAGFQSQLAYGPKESFIFASPQQKILAFDEEKLFSKVGHISLSNLAEIEIPKSQEPAVNSVFKPLFLTE